MSAATHRAGWTVFSMALLLASPGTPAQDSFGDAQRTQPQRAQPRPQPTPANAPDPRRQQQAATPSFQPRPSAASGEGQDYGVAPQAQLRPSDALHAPTPTSLPGGRVIGTRALAQLLKDPASKPLLFHVYGATEHIPGAIQAAPAGQGGGFDDDVQRGFGAFLKQTTGGSDTRPLVFYCQGVQCWMSYNAALRAIRMGQRNVFWYRGGLEAWTLAGLPTEGGASGGTGAGTTR